MESVQIHKKSSEIHVVLLFPPRMFHQYLLHSKLVIRPALRFFDDFSRRDESRDERERMHFVDESRCGDENAKCRSRAPACRTCDLEEGDESERLSYRAEGSNRGSANDRFN